MGCWEADVRLPLPSGEYHRERVRVPVSGRTSAKRWADAREAEVIALARHGLDAQALRARLSGKESVKAPQAAVPFYTFEEYASLVAAAVRLDRRVLVAVLLGGDAGLRAGEVIGLELPDVSRANARITVERQVWRGVADTSKGGKGRVVPMTERLAAALAAVRHLRGHAVHAPRGGAQGAGDPAARPQAGSGR
jgi:integrase